MPQFDFFSFFVQIFWLSIFSCILYLVYLKMPLNKSSQALKMRAKLTSLTSKVGNNAKIKSIYLPFFRYFK